MLRQPPNLSKVSIGTFVAALFVEADLAACYVKIVISMQASPCSTDFIHLERVSWKLNYMVLML